METNLTVANRLFDLCDESFTITLVSKYGVGSEREFTGTAVDILAYALPDDTLVSLVKVA